MSNLTPADVHSPRPLDRYRKKRKKTKKESARKYVKKLNTRAPLDRSPKKNWVENRGGLPMYIRRIANHLHAEKGMSIGHAIATAVNAVKKMCATGDVNWPGSQNVNAGSRAEACAAVADWERKKGMSKSAQGIRKKVYSDKEFIDFLVKRYFSTEDRKKLKAKGLTDSHGGYPLEVKQDIKNAVRAIGRAKNPDMEKRRIIARARKLDCMHLIPDHWVSKAEISDAEFEILAKWVDDDHPDTFEVSGDITKLDESKMLAFGWASVGIRADGSTVLDKQGDILDDPEEIEKAAYDFVLNSRDGGEMHLRRGVASLVESMVFTPEKIEKMGIPEGVLPIGWWVGFKVSDPEVWDNIKKGKYKMFSVHGRGTRKALEDGE